jgi:hypothetical protein
MYQVEHEGMTYTFCEPDCLCLGCQSERAKYEAHLRGDDLAEWEGYKPTPTEWWDKVKRRMRGEQTLLTFMDVYDRLEWFHQKTVRIAYPESSSNYCNRILLLTERDGHWEFDNVTGVLKARRNIWLSAQGTKNASWSYEDKLLSLIFNFMSNPFNFVEYVGCRDHCYQGDFPKIEGLFKYGWDIRRAAMEKEKERAEVEV